MEYLGDLFRRRYDVSDKTEVLERQVEQDLYPVYASCVTESVNRRSSSVEADHAASRTHAASVFSLDR